MLKNLDIFFFSGLIRRVEEVSVCDISVPLPFPFLFSFVIIISLIFPFFLRMGVLLLMFIILKIVEVYSALVVFLRL